MENQLLLEKYFPKTWEDIKLPERIKNVLTKMQEQKGYRLMMYSSPGTGKCLGYNTPVLMYDGSIKHVQDIKVGDKLMGIDSKPRNVLSITNGREEMFLIKPNKGESWTCNKSHILSVIESGKWLYKCGETINSLDIEDVQVINTSIFKKNHKKKLFRVPLDFEEKSVKIPPYILGFWLGDGVSMEVSMYIAKQDYDYIAPIMYEYANKMQMFITETSKNSSCPILRFVKNKQQFTQTSEENVLKTLWKEYNLFNNKHIPKDYLLNSRKTRLLLFAGFIDSDGGGSQSDYTYDIIIKTDRLKDDIVWLCRSLGYNVSVSKKLVKKLNGKEINKEYWRLIISGDFTDLNKYIRLERKRFERKINKNPLVTGFKIIPIGEGDYYGFEIDGDKRFMLGDFTVTHNTTTARLLVSDTSKFETMYLSGSNDFNIETLRQKVMQFSTGFSVTGKHKVVIIDECENIRDNIQDAFKILLDQCKSVSFIFITNEIEKVNTAIRSRCTQLEYDFSGVDLEEQRTNFIKYAVEICKNEGIEYDNKGIKELYIKLFPDFRHLIVSLQQIIDSEQKVTYETIKALTDNGKQNKELYDLILDNTISQKDLYEKTSKFKGKERDCLISLGEPFFEFLNEQEKFDKTLQVAVIVAKYSEMFVTSINKFVTLLSCIVELKSLFK